MACHLEGAKEVVVVTDHKFTLQTKPSWTVSPLCSSEGGRCVGMSFCLTLTSSGGIARALPMQVTPSVAASH